MTTATDHHTYRQARTLLTQALATSTASDWQTLTQTFLREHCAECGTPLSAEETAVGTALCPTCTEAARQRATHVTPTSLAQSLHTHGVPSPLDAQLATFLLDAPEGEVCRFNAHWLAETLPCPPRTLLNALAQAVTAGALEVEWELYCLNCLHQQPAFAAMPDIQPSYTCKHCHTRLTPELDEEVAITFTVAPRIRSLSRHAFDRPLQKAHNQKYGIVTGKEILTIQGFHDMFMEEPPPTHTSLAITRLVVLFSDLGGSTALYARQGDPKAYALVRDHFMRLTDAVAASGGAVVKTIGDAIMAVFPTGPVALAAAHHAQRVIAALNHEKQLHGTESLQLKIGLHAGPCIAVALNTRLDYFGTTVNAAARVQKLAGPGEIVCTAEVFNDQPEARPPGFAETVILRGLEDRTFTVYRLEPTEPTP